LEEHNPCIGAWDAEFQPPLLLAERLIGEKTETQYVCIKRERPVLIGYRNTDKLDASDHVSS
jgi:hypothetical protein